MSSLRQDVNVGLIVFVGVVGAMVLLILALGVQAWFAFESDKILERRYAADDNVEWINHKAEQYANLGDTIGNGTVYASEVAQPTRFGIAGEGTDVAMYDYVANDGYRFTSDEKDRLILPIHEAMAAFVRQHGGNEGATAQDLEAADRDYVHLVNDAFVDPQSYVTPASESAGAAAPSTRPSAVGHSATDAH